jgi:hypothetical protein
MISPDNCRHGCERFSCPVCEIYRRPIKGNAMKTPSTISELILELQGIMNEHGDLPVRCDTLTHSFRPDLVVRTRDGTKILILNS